MWNGPEDDDIVIGRLMQGRKVTNIARDPRAVLTGERIGGVGTWAG